MKSLPTPFDALHADPDTTILKRKLVDLQGHPAVHERWRWDGLTGESLILALADVGGVDDTELIAWSHASGIVPTNEKPLVKRTETGFVFLNFGYRH